MNNHAGELPVQLWDDLAHSLGRTSGLRDILCSPIVIEPQFPRSVGYL